jgi:hypothetical protein
MIKRMVISMNIFKIGDYNALTVEAIVGLFISAFKINAKLITMRF